jgi:acetyl/propionyl-CoA carboxylase alpha subunit
MIQATVNGKQFAVEGNNVNGENLALDLQQINERDAHVLLNHQSYNTTLISYNAEEKKAIVRVNGNDYEVALKNNTDLLLEKLGMGNVAAKKINNLKAPMPGLIVSINVAEGQEVKKGDAILVLEAMKMENVIKAPADVTIKKINVALKQAVEKSEVLVEFGV